MRELPAPGQRILSMAAEIAGLGPRLPGSKAERECHRLVAERLASTGGSIAVEEFEFLDWTPISQKLALTKTGYDIPARQLGYSADGELTGKTIYCGEGSEEDCRGAEGGIAICSGGLGSSNKFLHRIQKYRNAVEAEAVAFILVGESGHPAPHGMIRKRRRGRIPALTVAYDDARGRIGADRPSERLELSARSHVAEATSRNTLWQLGEGEEGVVICAHVDSWTPGAWDNASGTATLLELAHWLPRAGLRRPVTLCFAGAEEYGLFGSTSFCDRHAGEFSYAVNVDGVGLEGAELQARCSDRRLAAMPALHGVHSDLPLTPWGDHYSFYRAGIRTIFLTSGGISPVQHTTEDEPDRLNPGGLESSLALLRRIVSYMDSIL
jgi:aminopeptidase YwaD